MSERRQLLLASGLLVVIAALLLFTSIRTSPFEVYDEGLYGMYGRTALRWDNWLNAVNTAGTYPTGAVKFSKPPLSIWAVALSMRTFGPSLFSLRLPFALASFGIALLCLAFGRLLAPGARGTWLGFGWGVLFLACHGTTAFGRTATIEPLLVVFVMLALYCQARALSASTLRGCAWASVTGVAIAGAFMTKQVVCVLALLPIVGVELGHLRSQPSAVLLRLLVAVGIPLAAVGGWFYLFYAKVGAAAFEVLWQHAIVDRVSGFDGTHHQNFLNRVPGLLDLDAPPISWELGLFGLLCMLFSTEHGDRPRRDAGFLIVGAGSCAWLAFDVGSRAILPWYAFSLLPALALGHAWLAVQALHSLLEGWPTQRHAQLTAAGGFCALLLSVGSASRELMPALLAVALAGLGLMLLDQPRFLAHRRALGLGWSGAWLAFVLLGTLARSEYRANEPNTYAELGHALYEHGAQRVSLDAGSSLHPYERTTFFGADVQSGPAPWTNSTTSKHPTIDARIETEALPSEVLPRPQVTLIRGIGAYAVLGDLKTAPFASLALEQALDHGGLTFEAEQLATGRPDTLAHESGASGGALRANAPRFRERAESFSLVHGTTPRLPVGHYTAKFWLRVHCSGFRGELLGQAWVSVRGHRTSHALRCDNSRSEDSDAFMPELFNFEISSLPSTLELAVQIEQGPVALDRITLTRAVPVTPTPATPPSAATKSQGSL